MWHLELPEMKADVVVVALLTLRDSFAKNWVRTDWAACGAAYGEACGAAYGEACGRLTIKTIIITVSYLIPGN